MLHLQEWEGKREAGPPPTKFPPKGQLSLLFPPARGGKTRLVFPSPPPFPLPTLFRAWQTRQRRLESKMAEHDLHKYTARTWRRVEKFSNISAAC